MDKNLCSNNFRQFYLNLTVPAPDIPEYFEGMKEAIKFILSDLQIGRCVILVNSPANCVELEEVQDRSIIHSDEKYNEDCHIRQTFVTSDWGVIQIDMFAKDGIEWDAEEEEEIAFVIQVMFDCIGKTRAGILLEESAITDPLTGACNSTGMSNYLFELSKEGSIGRFSSLFFNIKNLNYINQRVGAKQADTVLKSFAHMIRDYLVKGELFARVGGGDFLLLVNSSRVEDFLKFLTSRKVLVEFDNKSMEFSLMIRVGIYPIKPDDTPIKVMDSARAAYLYTKNPSAGDVVWFEEEMLERSAHDDEVCNDFARALEKREFVVYYQPKVELKNTDLVSAEALCRWVRNGHVVPPMDFIPALEREGSICNLDFYMLNRVCEHINDWLRRGIEPVRISVNFSRANILNKKLAERILQVLKTQNVDTKYIEVEITEMSGYEDFESLSEFVNIMKANGVETSIDDFGTGYSSLNLIKDLNVDTIKLDKSFISKISREKGDDRADKSVVKSIINMVNELNMKVVAEGVETASQLNFLRKVNCQVGQGYLFDKPLPKEQFEFRLMGERLYIE